MRSIAVLFVVSVILWFRHHTSDKFQEAISWSITWRFVLHCLPLKYVVSDHFRWSNAPVNQINWNCVFILIKFAHGTDVWNSLSSASTSMWSLWKLFHPVKQWLKSLLRDHWPLTTYNNSKPIISALFSRESAKPLRSPRLVKLNSFKFDRKRCNTSRFSRPFCLSHLLENDFFLLVFSKAAILSLTFLLQILNHAS